VHGELIDNPRDVERLRSQWDDLAISSKKPYCSPAWMLSWWRHVAPPSSLLRIVVVLEKNELLGVAPLFTDKGFGILNRYRLLGGPTSSRVDMLATNGLEREVAEVFAAMLSEAQPNVDVLMFEGIPEHSPWPQLLEEFWSNSRRPRLQTQFSVPAPSLILKGRTYEEWLGTKSRNFRKSMRYRQRQIDRCGGTFRLACTNDEIQQGLASFAHLHHARWRARGGSGVLNRDVELMLKAAAHELVSDLRLRLWTLEVNERIISAQIFLAAGGEVAYWLGGFDEDWAPLQPSIMTILAAIEHAYSVGDDHLDLGGGGQDYKYRFADGQDVLKSMIFVPRLSRYPLARVQLMRTRVRLALAARLSPDAKRRLRRVRERVASFTRSDSSADT
jgi:CelD/BcsL family acetyltransferase involved in cellulose biosynthesis